MIQADISPVLISQKTKKQNNNSASLQRMDSIVNIIDNRNLTENKIKIYVWSQCLNSDWRTLQLADNIEFDSLIREFADKKARQL